MSRLTQHEDAVTPAIRWYFGGGLGCAMLSMAAVGFTHRELEPMGTTRLGRVGSLKSIPVWGGF
jgi:hypothetical protein